MAPAFSKGAEDGEVPRPLRRLLRGVRRLLRAALRLAEATQETLAAALDECGAAAAQLLNAFLGACCPGALKSSQPLPALMPAIFVILIVLSIYFTFVTCYLPAVKLSLASMQSVGFHLLTALSFLAYYLGVVTDPGYIPENETWRSRPPPLLERKKSTGERRFCQKEHKFKPDRSHFCSALGKNVLRMDHYCPWLVNCVGYNNNKYFILFVLYATVAVDWCAAAIWHALYSGAAESVFGAKTFFLFEALGLTGLLAVLLTPFLGLHIWLISRNMTTIEFCEHRGNDGDYESKYDIGVWRNIQSIMGRNMFFWLLPTPPLGRGDGLQFWLRAGSKPEDPEEPDSERRLRLQLEVQREPFVSGFFNVLSESVLELGTDLHAICVDVCAVRADLFSRGYRILTGTRAPDVQEPQYTEWTSTETSGDQTAPRSPRAARIAAAEAY